MATRELRRPTSRQIWIAIIAVVVVASIVGGLASPKKPSNSGNTTSALEAPQREAALRLLRSDFALDFSCANPAPVEFCVMPAKLRMTGTAPNRTVWADAPWAFDSFGKYRGQELCDAIMNDLLGEPRHGGVQYIEVNGPEAPLAHVSAWSGKCKSY